MNLYELSNDLVALRDLDEIEEVQQTNKRNYSWRSS